MPEGSLPLALKNDLSLGPRMTKDRQRQKTFDPGTILSGRGTGQSRLRLAPEHIIYAQGDSADALFYIESGRIKLSVVAPSGKQAVIAIRREGEFCSEICLLGQRQRRFATATTLTGCSVVRVTRAAMVRLLRQEPDFAEMFIGYLIGQRAREQESFIDQLMNSSELRLARTLLQLANFRSGDGPSRIPIPIRQAVLANMIGTTRPRVSFFMNKFKRRGYIEYDRHGHVSVRDSLLTALQLGQLSTRLFT